MAEEKNWDDTFVWNICNNDCGVAAGSLVWLCVQPCNFTVQHLSDVSAACTSSVSSSLYRARRLSDEAMLLCLLDNAAAVKLSRPPGACLPVNWQDVQLIWSVIMCLDLHMNTKIARVELDAKEPALRIPSLSPRMWEGLVGKTQALR